MSAKKAGENKPKRPYTPNTVTKSLTPTTLQFITLSVIAPALTDGHEEVLSPKTSLARD